MSRKRFITILAAILMSLVCGSLLSSDTFAASTIVNNLHGYQTNLVGIGTTQGYIRFQDTYNFTGNTNYSYIANGEFLTSWDWNYGHEYQVIFVQTIDATGVDLIVPNPIFIEGDNYHTEEDNIQSSISCGSSTCKYTMIHTLKVVGDNNGSEVVKVPSSVLLNIKMSGSSVSGKYNLYVVLFDNVDEALAFRSNLMNKLNDIQSDTSDIVDTLSDIYSDTSSINRNLQSIVDSQEQANQDANDRYEDEKDTIDTNTSGGIDAVDDIDTTINLPNPLSFLLGSLSVSSCYDISTLAGMVGSSDSQYCSWFSSSTRTIMTPFVDVLVFFIGSMFIWSWVKKGGL